MKKIVPLLSICLLCLTSCSGQASKADVDYLFDDSNGLSFDISWWDGFAYRYDESVLNDEIDAHEYRQGIVLKGEEFDKGFAEQKIDIYKNGEPTGYNNNRIYYWLDGTVYTLYFDRTFNIHDLSDPSYAYWAHEYELDYALNWMGSCLDSVFNADNLYVLIDESKSSSTSISCDENGTIFLFDGTYNFEEYNLYDFHVEANFDSLGRLIYFSYSYTESLFVFMWTDYIDGTCEYSEYYFPEHKISFTACLYEDEFPDVPSWVIENTEED